MAEPKPPEDGLLDRWERRKRAVAEEASRARAAPPAPAEQVEPAPPPTDADMPPLESLTFDSNYAGFLSPAVSEGLRRLALRKLFHSPELNQLDGLNDYDQDYTSFEPLGDWITHHMKRWLEAEEPADEAAGEPDPMPDRVVTDETPLEDPPDQAPPATAAADPQGPAAAGEPSTTPAPPKTGHSEPPV